MNPLFLLKDWLIEKGWDITPDLNDILNVGYRLQTHWRAVGWVERRRSSDETELMVWRYGTTKSWEIPWMTVNIADPKSFEKIHDFLLVRRIP